jgi:hypothetical protein
VLVETSVAAIWRSASRPNPVTATISGWSTSARWRERLATSYPSISGMAMSKKIMSGRNGALPKAVMIEESGHAPEQFIGDLASTDRAGRRVEQRNGRAVRDPYSRCPLGSGAGAQAFDAPDREFHRTKCSSRSGPPAAADRSRKRLARPSPQVSEEE